MRSSLVVPASVLLLFGLPACRVARKEVDDTGVGDTRGRADTGTDADTGDTDTGATDTTDTDTGDTETTGTETGDTDTTTDTADTAAPSEVFDFAADFDDLANPNGVWTYGWAPDRGDPIVIFPDAVPGAGGSPLWRDSGHMESGAPAAWKNTSGSLVDGVPDGAASLHPGLHGEYTVAVFTAPADGVYAASIELFPGDVGQTTATVIVDGAATDLGVTTRSPSHDVAPTRLQAGDTLEVWVGPDGDGYFDNTPVTFVVERD